MEQNGSNVKLSGAKEAHLEEMIKICVGCKKIYREIVEWIPSEPDLSGDQLLLLTHALCPECKKRMYPEYNI
jgi:hypothetical protein